VSAENVVLLDQPQHRWVEVGCTADGLRRIRCSACRTFVDLPGYGPPPDEVWATVMSDCYPVIEAEAT
jgi:hypothetical protein